MSLFDSLVLNPPYHISDRPWEFDQERRLTDRRLDTRRRSELLNASPAISATSARTQTSMVFDEALSTATTDMSPSEIANELHHELAVWRQQANPAQWSVTAVTLRLLQHWSAIHVEETQVIRRPLCQSYAVQL